MDLSTCFGSGHSTLCVGSGRYRDEQKRFISANTLHISQYQTRFNAHQSWQVTRKYKTNRKIKFLKLCTILTCFFPRVAPVSFQKRCWNCILYWFLIDCCYGSGQVGWRICPQIRVGSRAWPSSHSAERTTASLLLKFRLNFRVFFSARSVLPRYQWSASRFKPHLQSRMATHQRA